MTSHSVKSNTTCRKGLLSICHFNGYTIGFHPNITKLDHPIQYKEKLFSIVFSASLGSHQMGIGSVRRHGAVVRWFARQTFASTRRWFESGSLSPSYLLKNRLRTTIPNSSLACTVVLPKRLGDPETKLCEQWSSVPCSARGNVLYYLRSKIQS